MNSAIKTTIITSAILMLSAATCLSQNKVVVKERNPKGSKVVVVKNKNHHVKKVKVYHPHWAPRANFHRRWVYFPRYNFYWDNYRNVYVVRNGAVWVISKTAPSEVKNVDLSKENNVELGEDTDEQDSVQVKNAEHQKEFKVE